MRTHPPSFQHGKGSYQRLDRLPPSTTVLSTPRRVLQLEGGDISSHPIRTDDESEPIQPLDVESSLMSGRDELVNLAGQLRVSLSTNYPWFGQEDMKVTGTQPIDVGCFAEVWAGETGGRSVVVKSHRYWTSAGSESVYEVINLIWCVTFVDGNLQRFRNEALVCSHLSDQNIVRFLGVYSTPIHPFALVFEVMHRLSLREYLSENCGVERLSLVCR